MMFNEYEAQYWDCRYMYIEMQWHQSIECNCTQKRRENKPTTPTFIWKWRRLSSTYIVDTTTEEAGRVRQRTKKKPFDTYWYIDKLTKDFISDQHTPNLPVKPPLRTPPTIQYNTTNILNCSSVERRKWNRINPTIFFSLLRTAVHYWKIANWK